MLQHVRSRRMNMDANAAAHLGMFWKAASKGAALDVSSPLWQKVEEHLWILELFNISLCQVRLTCCSPLWASLYLPNLIYKSASFLTITHKLKQLFKMISSTVAGCDCSFVHPGMWLFFKGVMFDALKPKTLKQECCFRAAADSGSFF